MLSRVANSIYWLNRYVERAENVARFIDVNLNLLLDSPTGIIQQWEPLVHTTGDIELFRERYGTATPENAIQFLAFDKTYPNSIISCLSAARENARSIREVISSEMWQRLNTFYFLVKDAAQSPPLSALSEFFAEVKMSSHLFSGVTDATMTHNEGWHFGQIGRFLERADKTARILDVKYYILLPSVKDIGTTLDEIQWMALLKSASAYEMYRKWGQHRIKPIAVTEFLILNREFPRSIQFCLLQAERSLHQITGTPVGTWNQSVERAVGKIRSELEYLTIEEIVKMGLHEFLDGLQSQINNVGAGIYQAFFALNAIDSFSPSQTQTQSNVMIRW
ncbi:alpha-E domain-containing protein [Merismopedia glauca]|uniref:DUF403 domain-containing protein n=1 Tax=Merismopedia glauca CCAP 1448/3 TaxID=1296344 RepID=A0A2T1CAG1_9CYAN|nr:alpha-E domain-containing protein [Merismopedia glauca]PSB05133.1 hypothetical protein C7B64_00895 [Merismopedia glauca CCAP 1448/3]